MREKVFIPVSVIALVLATLLLALPRRHEVAVQTSDAAQGLAVGVQNSSALDKSTSLDNKSKAQRLDARANADKLAQGERSSESKAAAMGAGDAEPGVSTARAASSPHDSSKKAEQVDEARQAAIETRVQELLDLGMEDDAQSLQTILSELSSADPEIRSAAVEATIQFGSADAIPELEKAMLFAENSQQRKEIDDAIEFLKLPKLTEVAASLHALPKLQPGGRPTAVRAR